VCPNRTAERARNRRQGKSDSLDAERIARELLAHPDLPLAFKRSQQAAKPDQVVELLGLWHQARRSVLKSQQHLLNEAEDMLQAMPEAIRDRLPASKAVWLRLRALTTLSDEMSGEDWDAPTALRLRLLGEHAAPSRSWSSVRKRSVARWPSWSSRRAPRSTSFAVSRRVRQPSCWSRWVTRAGSPTEALPASTAPHPYRPPRPKAMTSPSGIVSTEVATGASTRSCIGWR